MLQSKFKQLFNKINWWQKREGERSYNYNCLPYDYKSYCIFLGFKSSCKSLSNVPSYKSEIWFYIVVSGPPTLQLNLMHCNDLSWICMIYWPSDVYGATNYLNFNLWWEAVSLSIPFFFFSCYILDFFKRERAKSDFYFTCIVSKAW